MMVLVDTPVWSLALRPKYPDLNARERAVTAAMEEARAALVRPWLQLLISIFKNKSKAADEKVRAT
jgi:hypothetical protein